MTPMTLQQIFNLEGSLSPSHILQIREALPPNASPEDYLTALETAKAESDAALSAFVDEISEISVFVDEISVSAEFDKAFNALIEHH